MGNARRSTSPLPSQVQIRHLTALHLHRPTHSQAPPPPQKAPGLSPLPQETRRSSSTTPSVHFGSPNSMGVSKRRAQGLFGGEHSLTVAHKAPTRRGVVRPHDSPWYLAFGNIFKPGGAAGPGSCMRPPPPPPPPAGVLRDIGLGTWRQRCPPSFRLAPTAPPFLV